MIAAGLIILAGLSFAAGMLTHIGLIRHAARRDRQAEFQQRGEQRYFTAETPTDPRDDRFATEDERGSFPALEA